MGVILCLFSSANYTLMREQSISFTRVKAYCSRKKQHIAHAGKDGKMPDNACSGLPVRSHFMRKGIKCALTGSLAKKRSAAADGGRSTKKKSRSRGEYCAHAGIYRSREEKLLLGPNEIMLHSPRNINIHAFGKEYTFTRETAYSAHAGKRIYCSRREYNSAHAGNNPFTRGNNSAHAGKGIALTREKNNV